MRDALLVVGKRRLDGLGEGEGAEEGVAGVEAVLGRADDDERDVVGLGREESHCGGGTVAGETAAEVRGGGGSVH